VKKNLSIVFLILAVLALNHTKMDENDTWWHLALGRWMLENKEIYRTEIFSQVGMGRPFLSHEWLSEVLFYLFSSPSGKLLSYFKLFLIGSSCIGFGALLAKPYLKARFTLPLLFLLAFLITFRAPVRPQIFEILGCSYLILALHISRTSFSWKWFLGLIPVQILWANLHGSYLLGPVLLFLFALGTILSEKFSFFPEDGQDRTSFSRKATLFGFSVLLLAVSLINPFHFELIKKSFSVFFLDSYMKEHIREWFSVTRVEKGIWFYVWFFWISWGWISLFRAFKKVSLIDFGSLGLATLFPFFGVRYITLSALLSAPGIFERTAFLYPRKPNSKFWSIVFGLLAVFFFLRGYPMTLSASNPPGSGFSFGVVPTDIIQHIKANKIKGVMMNHYHDGAFIIYYLYPEVLPVMDSRTDFYGKDLFLEHAEAYQSMGLFNQYVTKYGVNLILVRMIPETEVLRKNLFESDEWTLEKFGLDNMLFRKVDSHHPRKSMEEITQDLNELALNRRSDLNTVNSETAYCGWIRLFGHCDIAPECQRQCEMSDEELSRDLGGVSPLCFKFSQVCFRKETACGPCPSLCNFYSRSVDRINRLGFHYPKFEGCF